MKIDFARQLMDLAGEPLVSPAAVCPECGRATGGEPLTLRAVAVSALNAAGRGVDGNEKMRRFELMRRVWAEDAPDLDVEDVALIKKLVGETQYAPIVTGQAWEMLDPKGGG